MGDSDFGFDKKLPSCEEHHQGQVVPFLQRRVVFVGRDERFSIEGNLNHEIEVPFLVIEVVFHPLPVLPNQFIDDILNGRPREVELELLLADHIGNHPGSRGSPDTNREKQCAILGRLFCPDASREMSPHRGA